MAKIKSIKQFKERVDGTFETLKTRDEGMRLMRRVPCAVFVNLQKVTGDELRIVCSAVQYCVLYRPMHGRVGGTFSHPRSARAVYFGVSLRIHSHLCGLWSRAEYRPSPYPRTSAASAQPRLSQRLRPRG